MITFPRREEPFPTWKILVEKDTAASLIIADLTPERMKVVGSKSTWSESTPALSAAKFELIVNLEEARASCG
jgi:hypothetical protein